MKNFGYSTSINLTDSQKKNACLSKGGITQASVDVRLVLKRALEVGATAMILAHNHPSGDLKPSAADKSLTKKINQAAATLDLKILDHIILTEHSYFSFADEMLFQFFNPSKEKIDSCLIWLYLRIYD